MLTCPDMAKEAVSELRAAGIEPTLDELASLFELARRVQEPVRRTSPWFEGEPIKAGLTGPTLRPMSIQADEWFAWYTDGEKDQARIGAAFCFAAERGHAPGVFDLLYDRPAANARLAQYRRELTCTEAELESAASRLIDELNPGDVMRSRREDPGLAYDFGDILAQLEAVTGRPREEWVTKRHSYAMRVLSHAIRHNLRGGAFGGIDEAPDAEYLKASYDFQAAVELIKERAANGNG